MKHIFAPLLAAVIFLSTPLPASAGLVPCGGTAQPPCSLCFLVSGVATLTNYLRDIMVFVALAIIVAMGILYIVSAGNPGMMETAKKGVFAALWGLVIILAAWIIVNTIMFTVFQAKSDLGVGASFSVSGGFEFDCDAALSSATSSSTTSSSTTSTSTSSSSSGDLLLCAVNASISVGDTKQALKALYKSNGSVAGCADSSATDVTSSSTAWSIAPAGMASINASTGMVTGGPGSGSATITATHAGITETHGVVIVPTGPGMIIVCPVPSGSLKVGNTQALTVYYYASGSGSCALPGAGISVSGFAYGSSDNNIMKPTVPAPSILGVSPGNATLNVNYTPVGLTVPISASVPVFVVP